MVVNFKQKLMGFLRSNLTPFQSPFDILEKHCAEPLFVEKDSFRILKPNFSKRGWTICLHIVFGRRENPFYELPRPDEESLNPRYLGRSARQYSHNTILCSTELLVRSRRRRFSIAPSFHSWILKVWEKGVNPASKSTGQSAFSTVECVIQNLCKRHVEITANSDHRWISSRQNSADDAWEEKNQCPQ